MKCTKDDVQSKAVTSPSSNGLKVQETKGHQNGSKERNDSNAMRSKLPDIRAFFSKFTGGGTSQAQKRPYDNDLNGENLSKKIHLDENVNEKEKIAIGTASFINGSDNFEVVVAAKNEFQTSLKNSKLQVSENDIATVLISKTDKRPTEKVASSSDTKNFNVSNSENDKSRSEKVAVASDKETNTVLNSETIKSQAHKIAAVSDKEIHTVFNSKPINIPSDEIVVVSDKTVASLANEEMRGTSVGTHPDNLLTKSPVKNTVNPKLSLDKAQRKESEHLACNSKISETSARSSEGTSKQAMKRSSDVKISKGIFDNCKIPTGYKHQQLSIILKRVEETPVFSDDLKQQLAKFKAAFVSTYDQEFEVEEIIDYSWCKETSQGLYHVKWVGYEDQLTWEPLKNIAECQEALKKFYLKRIEEREAAQPGRKRFVEVPPDPRTGFEKRSEFVNKICPPPCQSELEEFFISSQKKPIKMWSDYSFNESLDKLANSKKLNPTDQKFIKIREQIMLRHVKDKRRDQLQRLKDWESEINIISTDKALLKVENEVDLEGPPRHMAYINAYLPSPGIIIPDDPMAGCECPGGNCEIKTEKDCCPGMNGHLFPYTKYGKLRFNIGTPIFECNKLCKCGPDCTNRVVQKGRTIKLCIYRTSNGCGWGVRTLEPIKKGSFVVEYVGEVITNDEAEERGEKYDAEGKTYLFDLDFNPGESNLYTVDAAYHGNVSHFINHSCEPNLAIFSVWIDCLDPNLPRLCFFAIKDIARGEQLNFDYKQQTGPVENPSANVSDVGVGQTECKCGAPTCRKMIF